MACVGWFCFLHRLRAKMTCWFQQPQCSWWVVSPILLLCCLGCACLRICRSWCLCKNRELHHLLLATTPSALNVREMSPYRLSPQKSCKVPLPVSGQTCIEKF